MLRRRESTDNAVARRAKWKKTNKTKKTRPQVADLSAAARLLVLGVGARREHGSVDVNDVLILGRQRDELGAGRLRDREQVVLGTQEGRRREGTLPR